MFITKWRISTFTNYLTGFLNLFIIIISQNIENKVRVIYEYI